MAFAASKGYVFTADEVKEHAKARAKAAGRELTDAELDGVAGGQPTGTPIALLFTEASLVFLPSILTPTTS